jgi:hypothetical protein
MRLTVKNDSFAVFDNVFDQDFYDSFVKFFCQLDYAKNLGKHEKVWRLCDGDHYAGEYSLTRKLPFNSPLDALHENVKFLVKEHVSQIVGEEGKDWSEISYRPYIYPQGSRISWHNDLGYSGACIFYCHQEWNPSWGGELMVANVPSRELACMNPTPDCELSRKHIKPILDYYGFGNYISCLPNRMVFTKGDTWHTINRVDKDAGENLRFSFVAFFLQKKN